MFLKIDLHNKFKRITLVFFSLLLSACGDNQQAFLNIGDRGQSLAVVRDQAYWGGPWRTEVIIANLPQCQRRYPVEGLDADKIRLDVYQPEPGVFILNAGKRWYVTELQNCGFQFYQDPPPEPGEMVGSFRVKNNALQFTSKSLSKAETEVESVTTSATE
jgi:hypothetical protein